MEETRQKPAKDQGALKTLFVIQNSEWKKGCDVVFCIESPTLRIDRIF